MRIILLEQIAYLLGRVISISLLMHIKLKSLRENVIRTHSSRV